MTTIENAVSVLASAFPLASVSIQEQRWHHAPHGENTPETTFAVALVYPGDGDERVKAFRGATLAEAVGKAFLAKGGVN